MYQFTTTNIINSSLDSNGTTAKFAGSTTALKVARVGTFLKTKIVSVTKRAYYAGVKEVATIVIPTITAGLVARIEIKIGLESTTYSDYASYKMGFEKPIYVEIIASGTAATDATAFATQLSALKSRFGSSEFTVSVSSATITLTAINNYQRFDSIKVYKLDPTAYANSIITPSYTDTSATFTVTTSGKIGFGDDEWMSRRIVTQTLDNVRPFGISKDERPILGGNYSQYTLTYEVEKPFDYGIAGGLKSRTTHVFYVLSTLVTAFETALNDDAGLNLDAAGLYTVIA